MNLALHDEGEPVKVAQRHLNKLGSMLTVDGKFGPSMQLAVVDARAALAMPGPPMADDALQSALAAVPDPFVAITAPGATFIARAEVTSAKVYRDRNRFPTLPAKSGITIGIGYDLSAVNANQLRADWGDVMPASDLDRLAACAGKKGTEQMRVSVADISVPLPGAMKVYARRSLPAYLADVRRIYPQVEALDAARQTALVSLVYNRGAALDSKTDPKFHEDRREMRAIRDLLAASTPDAIAEQFESMTRLWTTPAVAGVAQRRRDEATLWRSGFVALQLA